MSNQPKKISEYQLREAAGKHWILHMTQKGIPYEAPFSVNAVAAEVWKGLQVGESRSDIAEKLSKKYGTPKVELQQDIQLFVEQLEKMGIIIEE